MTTHQLQHVSATAIPALAVLTMALWPASETQDRLVITDDQGNARIVIGTTPEGAAGIWLLDTDGLPTVCQCAE